MQQPSLDSQAAAMAFAEGMLEKYGYIPQVLSWKTYDSGLKAGQLINVNIPGKGIADDFLIEAVAARDDAGQTLYDVKALDGSALGGWEQVFKGLLQGGRKLVIRDNEVLILLNTTSEVTAWEELLQDYIYACPVPADDLYPSEVLYPC